MVIEFFGSLAFAGVALFIIPILFMLPIAMFTKPPAHLLPPRQPGTPHSWRPFLILLTILATIIVLGQLCRP